MDSHTLTVLEYGEVLSAVSSCAQSEAGSRQALAMRPSTTAAEVVRRLELTSEAMAIQGENPPALDLISDTAAALKDLRIVGAVLESHQLLALLANQKAVREVRAALRATRVSCPLLQELAGGLATLPDWERWLESAFDHQGRLLDGASPELREARREAAGARQSAVDRLEAFSRKDSVARVLQEGYVTIRNGRFVIPARPEYHRVFEGVVQDSSQSGQTLFVEPVFAVELNNRLTASLNRVREEEHRVLSRMSRDAAEHRPQMEENLRLLADFDLLFAKARFADRVSGVIPSVDDEAIDLVRAHHPLLVLDPEVDCVPVDLAVGGATRILVITGPNTGGKTAALKTLGLITLMVQSGLPVPVDPRSRVRVFEKVAADIGDEQSLAQSLSTFSAHISVISRTLRSADDKTLVLLDELGAGTDPQEGSALGVSLLEEFYRRGAVVVVTTHHNLLKEFAYRWEGAANASTIFDEDTLTPTYQLRRGMPGRSHAIQIAARLGLDERVISRAREVMGSGAVHVDNLLGRLSEEVDREAEARSRSETLLRELEQEREGLFKSREKLRKETGRIKEDARRKASTLIRDLERRGKAVLKDLRDRPREEARRRLQATVAGMEEQVRHHLPPPPPKTGGGEVVVGQEAEVVSLGVAGTVVKISGDEAVVRAGGIRMKVPLRQLQPAADPPAQAPARARVAAVAYQGDSHAPSEINLLGQTVEEALMAVDRTLDRSVMGPGRTVRIVHGKGTGALKKAIAKALKDDPRVASYAPGRLEEGGAGVTIVHLKE